MFFSEKNKQQRVTADSKFFKQGVSKLKQAGAVEKVTLRSEH